MDSENLRNKSKSDLIKIIQDRDSELEALTARIEKLERLYANKNHSDKIIDLEKQLYSQQQYGRRETLEFVGIPDSLEGQKIEKKVVELCVFAGVPVQERSFHAVHRLKHSNTVIVKFVHLKDAINVSRNKKSCGRLTLRPEKKLNLKGKVYINESLCKPFRRLFGICNSLFKKKAIKGNFCINGKILVESLNGTKKVIGHLEDLIALIGYEMVENTMKEHSQKN